MNIPSTKRKSNTEAACMRIEFKYAARTNNIFVDGHKKHKTKIFRKMFVKNYLDYEQE